MKKTLKIASIASIFAISAIFGMFASNIDTTPELGHASMDIVDLQDQVEKSDYAVIGVVKEVGQPYPVKSDYAPRYFGDVIFAVEEDLFGTVGEKEITIRTHANVAEEVNFKVGERALLFLVKSSAENVEGEGVYVVRGMFQGKFSIENGIVKDPKYEELTYDESDLKTQIISSKG